MTKREIQAAEYREEVGPQRAKPASVAQIKAQAKQSAIGVLQAELADLRKRHGDNLEFIKTLVADKAVNQPSRS